MPGTKTYGTSGTFVGLDPLLPFKHIVPNGTYFIEDV